jgi:hypothetical protein
MMIILIFVPSLFQAPNLVKKKKKAKRGMCTNHYYQDWDGFIAISFVLEYTQHFINLTIISQS